MSFMRNSTLRGASEFAEIIFLRRSQPTARRKVAFGLERMSTLYFVLNELGDKVLKGIVDVTTAKMSVVCGGFDDELAF